MNWDALGAVAEIVASLGVIVSLVYLAIQIRSQIVEAKLAGGLQLANQMIDIYSDLSKDGEVARIFLAGIGSFDALEPTDRVRYSAYMNQLFRTSENAYHLQLNGRLNETLWQGFESSLTDVCHYAGVRAWWATRKHWYSEEFAAHVAGLMEAPGVAALYGEQPANARQDRADA